MRLAHGILAGAFVRFDRPGREDEPLVLDVVAAALSKPQAAPGVEAGRFVKDRRDPRD